MSETEARPWTEEQIASFRTAPYFEPSHPWRRWDATLKLRDEQIARLRRAVDETGKTEEAALGTMEATLAENAALRARIQELEARAALDASTTADLGKTIAGEGPDPLLRIEILETQLREADRVMTLEVEARREAEQRVRELELERASFSAHLAMADGAIASVASLREEIQTLKAQVRSADHAAIAATKARESAQAEAARLRSELDEVLKGALEAQELAEARRKRVVELETQVDRGREATLSGRTMQQDVRARNEYRRPWCPTHGHFEPLGQCPRCLSMR